MQCQSKILFRTEFFRDTTFKDCFNKLDDSKQSGFSIILTFSDIFIRFRTFYTLSQLACFSVRCILFLYCTINSFSMSNVLKLFQTGFCFRIFLFFNVRFDWILLQGEKYYLTHIYLRILFYFLLIWMDICLFHTKVTERN